MRIGVADSLDSVILSESITTSVSDSISGSELGLVSIFEDAVFLVRLPFMLPRSFWIVSAVHIDVV